MQLEGKETGRQSTSRETVKWIACQSPGSVFLQIRSRLVGCMTSARGSAAFLACIKAADQISHAAYRISNRGVQLAADSRGGLFQGHQLLFFIIQVCAGGWVIKGAGHAAAPLAPLPDGSHGGQSLPGGDVPRGRNLIIFFIRYLQRQNTLHTTFVVQTRCVSIAQG